MPNTPKASGGSGMTADLHKGLHRCNSKPDDSSTKLKGPSVNAEATRGKSAAPTPKTLGPRTA